MRKSSLYYANATDKALVGEMTMGEVIFSFAVVPVMAIVGCILLYCFLKGN